MVRSDLRVSLLTNEETVVTGRQPIRDSRQLELRVSSAQSVLCCRARQSPSGLGSQRSQLFVLTLSHCHTVSL